MAKPAILFITTDEQHLDTVYRADLPYSLPCLSGVMACSDVYETASSASPVCLPARCAWMTGLMPHRNGCISNNLGASLPLSRRAPLPHPGVRAFPPVLQGPGHGSPGPTGRQEPFPVVR